ncbi:uncharacterized protein Z519_09453 [Cladophialophora bantiana CBS 173.52]|uniref:Cyanuric acid amidohydrolase n=1 Tax=Cladophialophora bantiana (strain ATCC 10958 / CBS 173.52 / CDC B-1940 / NIH 8579) TaxID=1442370 RepID=A0A0D2H9Z2_CLAB1|nr:uncharacterized protein Z519_09453 [Cladophialophora bantiana CBS 173.52]KIW90023.1 hypothetical protein Z519_09453 [Cladophialophora bantiana CBS 173.52]
MAAVDILKFPILSPADTTPLDRLKEAGYEASQILAVVGKTEGNGCVNDFSRTLASAVWEPRIPQDAVTIFSGGTEGVLSPHVTFFIRAQPGVTTGLVAAIGRTRVLAPHEVGTSAHSRQVAQTVSHMMQQASVTPAQVHLVLVKCPLLTSAKIEAIRAESRTPVTTDTYESMAKSRYASAVGIALALEELSHDMLEEASASQNVWSAKASCSSGAELEDCHVLVLATDPAVAVEAGQQQRGHLHAVSRYMADAIDASAVCHLLAHVKGANGKVVQVFAKAEADPSGRVRSWRHTMNTDSDIHSTRHARAAVGGLIAGLVSDCEIYVSGGAEGQGPSGGGSLCMVYKA